MLLIPEWTQPTLSQDEIRRNGGVPPPPTPNLPQKFVIQLYNPDQQIAVQQHPSSWSSAQHWDFEMPQQTFRQPSASTLDRGQSDPSAEAATPTVAFRWKREGKLSKDLICNLRGKSRNLDGSKRKHKEPDIPLAFLRALREMSVYEPNLMRVELEDPKGFEVALLLSAAVVRDVYFGSLPHAFNIADPPRPRQNSGPRRSSGGHRPHNSKPAPPVAAGALAPAAHAPPPPPSPANPTLPPRPAPRPPPTDPRSQWEIDAETARLRAAYDAEHKDARRRAQQREAADRQAAAKMAAADEKAARKRQKEADRETERLRREFAKEQRRVDDGRHRQRRKSAGDGTPPAPAPAPHQQQPVYQRPLQPPPQPGFYMQPAAAGTGYFGESSGRQGLRPQRSSFFGGLLGPNERDDGRLQKKKSSMF